MRVADNTMLIHRLVAFLGILLCTSETRVGAFQIKTRTHRYFSLSIKNRAGLLPVSLMQTSKQSGSQLQMKAAKRYSSASTSPLFNGQSSNGDVDTSEATKGSIVPYVAPWVRAVAIFGLGYGIGGASAPGWQRQAKVMKKIQFTRILLVVLILRDVWRSTPQWAKPRITRYGKKAINIFTYPIRKLKGAKDEIEAEVIEDIDDITDFSNFATKIQSVINVAKKKLELEDDDLNEAAEEEFNVQASFLAFIQLLWQIKFRRASSRDQIYRVSGTPVPDEILDGMDEAFELADLAYDEHKDGSLKKVLKAMGYNLMKHDKTAVPGYLGHYIAINADPTKEKVAIIGVKGTSNLEDFLTDMCASAVEYNLTNPFYEGGSDTLRCHEGVFISSQRLAEDLLPFIKNLLLPSGYKIVIAGHSLGAACATMLAINLMSNIPSLRDSGNMKVWAFASPPVLDLNSALGCSSFVTTVVNNCDVVPRTNISPLAVTVSLLRAVNKKLKEQELDLSNFKSTLSFLNKIKEGKDGDMIMDADDIALEIDNALEKEELEDPDHLYVPGKVVVMYDLWEKEQQKSQDKGEGDKDFSNTLKDWLKMAEDTDMHSSDAYMENITTAEEAILCDGTGKVLRFVELDGRLLDDHMAPQYRSSISNILSSRKSRIVEETES